MIRQSTTLLLAALLGVIGGALFLLYFDTTAASAIWVGCLVLLSVLTIEIIEKKYLQERLRRMRFLYALMLRTSMQSVVIFFYIVIGDLLHVKSLTSIAYDNKFLAAVLYIITLSLLVNAIRQMGRMLGQNVLMNMIIGKYTKPIEEERIFMFLDLDASTTIAERLGNIRYHNLLDDYVFDITRPILECGGEIYQYVGDEVVVTWPIKGKRRSVECLNCFFRISETMERLSPKYQATYGFVPGFKAGFHSGVVVTGQIGDVKKEIVFQGDVVNTASRIKETCSTLGARMLLSRELLDKLPLENSPYKALRVGSFLLKGKEHEVELFSIVRLGST